MPVADVVYLELQDPSAMLFRFTVSGEFCGDTWHESLQDAYEQATFEFGDALGVWQDVPEHASDGREFAVEYANRRRDT